MATCCVNTTRGSEGASFPSDRHLFIKKYMYALVHKGFTLMMQWVVKQLVSVPVFVTACNIGELVNPAEVPKEAGR